MPTKLRAIAEAGFEGVEPFEMDVLADVHSPREIGRTIADLGLRCVTLQPFRDFESLPAPGRGRRSTGRSASSTCCTISAPIR